MCASSRWRWRRLPRPVSGVGVGLRLELARARAHQLLDGGRLDRAGGVGQPLDRVGEALGVASRPAPRAARAPARPGARRRRGPPRPRSCRGRCAARPARRRARLLVAQLVRVAVGARDRLHDVADQLRQLARDLLGRQLADLLERGALDQPDQPSLGELVPRAVEAREGAPDRCHALAVTAMDRSSPAAITILPPETAELTRLSRRHSRRRCARCRPDGRADPDRGGPRAGAGGGAAAAAEDVPLARGARPGAGRGRRERRLDVPPFDSSAMDGFAVVAGPGGRAAS